MKNEGLRIWLARACCVSLFFILHSSFLIPEARAYDFAVRISNGDSLFFHIVDGGAVAVVAPVRGGDNFYLGHQQPSGVVAIPETVEWEGQRYAVTEIGDRAFCKCTKIQLVTMPATLERIGAFAFYGCTGIKGRISIGPNVKMIGASAFYGCTSIPEVNFRAEDCTFMGGSISTTVFGNCRSLKRVLIDEGVRRIPDYAFCGVDAITDSIDLPMSLREIGDYAFAYCSKMSDNLEIPDSVESVGECAYHQCHSLKSVSIGASVKKIGGRAFYHCIGLKRIKVKTIAPADITVTTFSDIGKMAKLSVPCVSKAIYEKNGFWKRVGAIESYGGCTFRVTGTVVDTVAGIVVGGGEYAYGEEVTLMAVCRAGYGFVGWTDGNRENPRGITVTGSMNFVAETQPSGIVRIVDTVYNVDTVYAEGYKVVHDTIDMVEEARSINDLEEVSFDGEKKKIKWNFPRREKVVSVSLYNPLGECVYFSDGRKGNIAMRRYPSGTYILRIETIRRVVRCRFFVNNGYGL